MGGAFLFFVFVSRAGLVLLASRSIAGTRAVVAKTLVANQAYGYALTSPIPALKQLPCRRACRDVSVDWGLVANVLLTRGAIQES